jgi:transcriptional regulator with XRE-family HTH domain
MPDEHEVYPNAADRNTRRPVNDLLTELSEARGVTWSDIAAALGISVPTLRKWRKSVSGTTPENHRALAELTAFFSVLAQAVDSPARWMSMPLVSGFNVTPFDVYSTDHAARFLDLAAGNVGVTAEGVLDAVAPDWRDRWKSEHEVFEAVDGELSMRPRRRSGSRTSGTGEPRRTVPKH